MRKLICLIGTLVLCLGLGCQVFAAEQNFVPSITYKGGPVIDSAEMNTESVGGCLIVTSIQKAEEKETDISQDSRDLLLDVYKQLCDGTMKLPPEAGGVILELIDVSFREIGCVRPEHMHEEELEEPETEVTVKFDMDIPKGVELKVYVYHDEEWKPVEKVTVNEDGTVTCVFEVVCPVVFCVDRNIHPDTPKTGDNTNMMLWMAVLLLSGASLVVLLRRKTR